MPYTLQQVHGPAPLLVGEQVWGEATEIDFGAMTSCISIVAQAPGPVFCVRAIHLSVVDGNGTPIYHPVSNVLGQIHGIMQPAVNLRACLGRIDFWQGNVSPQVQDFFAALMQDLDIETWVQLPDGELRVRADNNALSYSRDGAWINIP